MAAPFERFPGASLPFEQLEGDPAQAVARVHEALVEDQLPDTVGYVTLGDIARGHDATTLGRAHPRVRAMLAGLAPLLERVGDEVVEVYPPDAVNLLAGYEPSADAGPPPAEDLFPYGPERRIQFLPDGPPYAGIRPLSPASLQGMSAAMYRGRVKPAGFDPEVLTGAEYTTDADRPAYDGYEDEEERR